ncbi:ABC transporter permease subunit [Bacillus sp. APMAM]|uniref:ABC transporter permease subunit n=1 Tax=Margalitia sp. FSL K6-0131 TaxID=2954604 RepID=UPI000F89D366|nr:ABC transporter permease subunit [Bacillus sp. APMAM]RTZ57694.1 ABC transporter permease subunit [Bacillus sp. SAJ1]
MRKIPSLWIGIIGCTMFAIFFFFGPYLPKVDKNVPTHSYVVGPESNLDFILPPYPPNKDFLLGSDKKGRDIYSALIMGTRGTLTTVFSISVLTFLIAIPLGVAAAHLSFFRYVLQGWNYLFSRLPVFFYVIIISTIPFFIFSPHRAIWMISFLIIFELGKVGEVVYKSVKLIQNTTYYEAGILTGSKPFGLWKRYYLPNCYPQWVAYFVQHIGSMLFLLGQLGIFGIFISQSLSQQGSPAYSIDNTALVWPMFLFDVLIDFDAFPWVPLFGSMFITLSMFVFVSLGEGILEYHLRKHRGLIVQRKPFLFRWRKQNQTLFSEEKRSETKIS